MRTIVFLSSYLDFLSKQFLDFLSILFVFLSKNNFVFLSKHLIIHQRGGPFPIICHVWHGKTLNMNMDTNQFGNNTNQLWFDFLSITGGSMCHRTRHLKNPNMPIFLSELTYILNIRKYWSQENIHNHW
jgi:hypothetical protein